MIPQRGFAQRLSEDCLDPSKNGFVDFVTPRPAQHVFEGVGIRATGTFDPATSSGSVTSDVPALRIDNFNAHSRAIVVGWFGLKTSGAGAIVTGRIQRTRTIFSRVGPRKPLLRIKRLGFQAGPFQRKGRDVPDTFVIGMSGRATILPALAREVTRIRCRGPHIVTSRPIRAGTPFGTVQLQLRPDAAVGIGGTFDLKNLRLRASTDTSDSAVTVTPSSLHADLPADLRTPLSCEASYACVPRVGTQFAIGAGFVLSFGDRSTTVADLVASYVESNGRVVPTVTGTIDGSPVTVITTYGGSADFEDRVAAALGVITVRATAGEVAAHFAHTAAP